MTAKRASLPIVHDEPDARDRRSLEVAQRERVEARLLAAAQRFLDDGDVDEAARKLAPLATDPTNAVRAHAALLYAGVQLMAGGARAAGDALAVLARIPASPAFPLDDGYRRMIEACALRSARRFAEALVAARAAVAYGPTSGRLLVLADAEKHAGHLDDAARTLEALLEREPRHPTALAQLAGYRNLQGALDDGARLFEAFADVVGRAQGADADRNAAFYFATRGDIASTIAALERALVAEPQATRGYIDDEVELDRFRADDAFRALLARAA